MCIWHNCSSSSSYYTCFCYWQNGKSVPRLSIMPKLAITASDRDISQNIIYPVVNTWYFSVLTYENDIVCLYVNGTKVIESQINVNIGEGYAFLQCGSYGGDYITRLCSPRIYKRVLTQDEINVLFKEFFLE